MTKLFKEERDMMKRRHKRSVNDWKRIFAMIKLIRELTRETAELIDEQQLLHRAALDKVVILEWPWLNLCRMFERASYREYPFIDFEATAPVTEEEYKYALVVLQMIVNKRTEGDVEVGT